LSTLARLYRLSAPKQKNLEERSMANPVSATAYFCAGVRMLDAKRPDSLLSDHYAERFMGEDGRAVFEKFKHLPASIGANQVRIHLVDDIVRRKLREYPDLLIVLLGAGFDSRAFRMRGGRWLEVDEAPIVERKEKIAPAASCPNPLERVAIDFARESLARKLAPWRTGAPVLVICEGVMMYLVQSQIETLVEALKTNFPEHWLCGDLLTRTFALSYGLRMTRAVSAIGAHYHGLVDFPLRRLKGFGYRPERIHSVMKHAAATKRAPLPGVLKRTLWAMPLLRNGYRIALLRSV
jgi:methyltransferase (TIGR00027 family)